MFINVGLELLQDWVVGLILAHILLTHLTCGIVALPVCLIEAGVVEPCPIQAFTAPCLVLVETILKRSVQFVTESQVLANSVVSITSCC